MNTAETAYRRKAGNFMVVVSAVVAILLFVFGAHSIVRFVVVAPLIYLTAISYLQAKNKFCVQYAATGKQNTDESSEQAVSIADEKATQADKAKAKKMHIQAAGIGIVVAILFASIAL